MGRGQMCGADDKGTGLGVLGLSAVRKVGGDSGGGGCFYGHNRKEVCQGEDSGELEKYGGAGAHDP